MSILTSIIHIYDIHIVFYLIYDYTIIRDVGSQPKCKNYTRDGEKLFYPNIN